MSYSVVQRTSEIGVRLALGAARGDILGMLLAQGMKPVALGVAAGVAGAALCTRLIRSMLYATSPGDPLTFLNLAAVLGAVAVLACCLPALRVTRIDPARTLRNEWARPVCFKRAFCKLCFQSGTPCKPMLPTCASPGSLSR